MVDAALDFLEQSASLHVSNHHFTTGEEVKQSNKNLPLYYEHPVVNKNSK